MAKSVSLSVHRNKVESRRKRVLASELTKGVGALVKEQDIRAYAVVGISSKGEAFALWDTGAILPRWAFADTIAGVLRKDIAANADDQPDDWRPSLTLKGGDQ